MTDLQRVKISMYLFSARFWFVIIVLYLSSKNLSNEEIFTAIGIFYFMTVVLEFPTGVIGDHFSHKMSVILGNFFLGISMLFIIFVSSFYQMIIFYFFSALGMALISGSNTALLHSISKDFKDDIVHMKIYSTAIAAIAIALGGWMASYNLNYPFYLQSIFLFLSILILIPVKADNQEKESGNIFATAKEGVKNVFLNKNLLYVIIFSALSLGFFFNLKWFYNPLFIELEIDVALWGIVGGLAFLSILLGSILYKKFPNVSTSVLFVLLLTSMFFMGSTNVYALSLAGLFFIHVLRGFLGTKFSVDINKLAKSTVRASVLSFQNLFIRLTAMGIVFVSGFVLERYSFFVLMNLILLFIFVFGVYSVFKINKFEQKI